MTTAAVNTAPPQESNDGVVNNNNSSKNLTKNENAQNKEKDGRKKSNRNNTRGGSNMTSKKKQSANHERKLQHLQNGAKEGISSFPSSVPKNNKVGGSNETSRNNNQNNQDGRKKKQASFQKQNPKITPKKDQIIPSKRNDNDDTNHQYHHHHKHSNRKSFGGDAHTQKNVKKENPQSQPPQQQRHRGGGRGGRRSRKQPSHLNNDNFHDQDTYYSQYDGNVGVTSLNTSDNRRRNGNGNGSAKKNNRDRKSRSNRESNNHEERDNPSHRGEKDYHSKSQKHIYPPHISLSEALKLYADTLEHESNPNSRNQGDGGGAAIVIRGKIRVMRGNSKDAMAFISCDRGSLKRDVVIQNEVDRNRALDGDIVYVQLNSPDNDNIPKQQQQKWSEVKIPKQKWTDGSNNVEDEDGEVDLSLDHLNIDEQEEEFIMDNYEESSDEGGSVMNSSDDDYEIDDDDDDQEEASVSSQTRNETAWTWQDDDVQCQLWDPAIAIPKPQKNLLSSSSSTADRSQNNNTNKEETVQYTGRVIHIAKPPTKQQQIRTIVGRIKQIHNGNRVMFVPTNTSLPQFVTPAGSVTIDNSNKEEEKTSLWKCEYHSGSVRSWPPQSRLPHCINLSRLGHSFNPADETLALLIDNGVNHGDFPPQALANVDDAVKSGRTNKALNVGTESDNVDLGWQPTEKMLEGRRDFRKERIFTIDPTTAKDLDDALHIKPLPNNKVEIGVHIADVSHFVKPHTAVDEEATRRATTVYLVDQTIPMLPRPLCEIACSLNENVDRLSFSCVWIMNMDGTLATSKNEKGEKEESVWYGKSVIRSCARLDYATAQNIIEEKVVPAFSSSNDDSSSGLTEELWPTSRRPTGGHTPSSIASDLRLMHKVAMARRALRFTNGALALHGVKLIFTFEDFEHRDSPSLAAPYPIKDSNRLVEEYMLIANYLVAQRLLTHAGGLALIRSHPPPQEKGLGDVVDAAKKLGFEIDSTDSRTLNDSLKRIGRECDHMIILQGITEMMMVPMQPAVYIAAGEVAREEWRHFALNIPYYTHFTSPIRRYADVMVHRLLQATLDDEKAAKANMNNTKNEQTPNDGAIANFHMTQQQIHATATHCNEKRMGAKHAQERSDRVFLSLYLKKNPIDGVLGIVTSLGEKTFTTFVPSLGLSQKVFLDEHKEDFESKAFVDNRQTEKRIWVTPKNKDVPRGWSELVISIFTKISVSCRCKDRPPIDVQIKILGPWMED